MSKDHDYEFKIILLGESGVGKTSLTVRYISGLFKAKGVKTVIVNSFSKIVTLKGIKCKLRIWDTSGQEIYKSMVRGYYKNVDGVLLVYDTTNIVTFNQLSSWLKEIKESSSGATSLIVGNKTDLPSSSSVSHTMVEQFARDESLEFIESSAKTDGNVIKIFEHLTLRILQDKQILPFDIYLSISSFTSVDMPQEEMSGSPSTKAEQAELDLEKSAPNQKQSDSSETAGINHISAAAKTSDVEIKEFVKKHTSSNRNISESAYNSIKNSHISMAEDTEHKLHIFLAGGPGVGKYCLALRYTTGEFDERGAITVVIRCCKPKFVVINGIKLNLFIWVLAGHERFSSCLKLYYGRADGFFLVYDITDKDSFNQLSNHLKNIREYTGEVPALIVGNKIDLSNTLSVSNTIVEEFARNEHLEFMESSAKTGQNVDKIFEYLMLKILQKKGILPFKGEEN